MPPQPSLCPTPGAQSRGGGEHRTLQSGTAAPGVQQVLRRAGEGSRTRRPPPRGRWEIRVSGRTPPGAPLEGGRPEPQEGRWRSWAAPGKAWQDTEPEPSCLGASQSDSVCSEGNDRPDAPPPPVPGHLPVDSRGRWTGTRLRREPRFPRRDADGHPAGPGLPTQRLCASPSSGSRPVAGRTARWQGHEEQDWPLTPRAGGRGPVSCRASPGHLHVTEPCLLTPVPACPSPGPSPAYWKYGWIIMGKTFVSSQNFRPL